MAKKVLVDADVQLGEKILGLLDAAKFPISVALWTLTEEDGWKFVIGTPLYEKEGPGEAHRRLIVALRRDDPESRDFDDVQLKTNRDPFVRELRRLFGKTASVKGMRLGSRYIGGVWLDDAVVYRVK
jgi:hypothetical protein